MNKIKKWILFSGILLTAGIFSLEAMLTPDGKVTDLISNKELPEVGIIVAHPERAERIATFLKDVDLHTNYRGYKIYTGLYKGKKVFAAYTAMGGPSVDMILENLIVAGAKKIVRVGTSDNDNRDQDLTTLTIVEEVIGLNGMMAEYGYEPEEIGKPLYASVKLVNSIAQSALMLGKTAVRRAKSYNIDAYHVFSNPTRFAKNPQRILEKIAYYKSQGATIRDMESGTLFMLGELRHIDVATVLISAIKHGQETEKQKKIMVDREGDAIQIVLNALTATE